MLPGRVVHGGPGSHVAPTKGIAEAGRERPRAEAVVEDLREMPRIGE